MLCLAELEPFKLFVCLIWLVVFVGPIVVLAALIWLVHTIWKYRHIPPKR